MSKKKTKTAGCLAFDLDKDEVIMREHRTPPVFEALVNAQQMLDDAKARTLSTGWQPGAARTLTVHMLCDDGLTRGLVLPEPDEKKLFKLVHSLPETISNAHATRYLFMMYSDEWMMIGAADAMGGKCCGYFEIRHGPAGGAFGEWHTVDATKAMLGLLNVFGA